MLADVYWSYRKLADEVDWKKYNVNDLFREYIKHENDQLKDNFYSALICRWWGYIGRTYTQCNKHIPFEQCYDCILDALKYVIDKRVWEKPESSLYNDPSAPDKAMHIAIKRQRGVMLANLTANKRQSNFCAESIDAWREECKDATDGLLFDIDTSEDNIAHMISTYFDGDDYTKGILLDLLCYSKQNEINYKQVARDAKDLNSDNFYYYRDKYSASEEIFKKTIYKIRNTSNKMLEIELKKVLYELRLVYIS